MIVRRALLATSLALAARPAWAIDPGVASGRYRRDEELVSFSHAVALSLDNVEDPSPRKREMRVLLSDREAPASAIMGLFFPPVWRMARLGNLRALLLTFDPDDRTGLNVVVLSKRDDGYSPPSISITNTAGLWSRLDISATRIAGDLKDDASENMSFSFSAPVFTNEVVADLTGPAAQASDPVSVVLARTEALSRGDLVAARTYSTPDSGASLTEIPPEFIKLAKAEMVRQLRLLKSVKRVVIRRETAAVHVAPGEWASLVRLDGVWKVSD